MKTAIKKGFLMIALAAALLAAGMLPCAAADAVPGGTVTVELSVTGATAAMTAKVGFRYDTRALEFVSAAGSNGWTAPQNAQGSFGIASADSPIRQGAIGSVTFRVKNGVSSGTYAVDAVVLRAVDTDYRSAALSVSGGSVTVTGNASTGETPRQPAVTETPPYPQDGTGEVPRQSAVTRAPSYPQDSTGTGALPCPGYTTMTSVNVRQEMSMTSAVITQLAARGTEVTVTGEGWDSLGTRWYGVRLVSGVEGYIRGDLLSLNGGGQGGSAAYPDTGAGLYGLAVQNLSTRSGPGTEYTEQGTYLVAWQYIRVLARAWDSRNGIWWVKCEVPVRNEYRVLWTGYKRFDSRTLPLESIPVEAW